MSRDVQMSNVRVITLAAGAAGGLMLAPLAAAQIGIGGGPVAKLYVDNCAKCHGDNGEGGGAGTRTLLDDKYQHPHGAKYDRIFFDAIRNGVKDDEGNIAGMEGFGKAAGGVLSDAEVWGVVVYLRELQHQAHREHTGKGQRGMNSDEVRTTTHANFTIDTVVGKGLDTPWSVDWLPDGRMLVTERNGDVRLVTDGVLSAPIVGVPKVVAAGQGGMMDVAVHPEYAKPHAPGAGWIYLSFSDPHADGQKSLTRVVRGKLADVNGAPTWTDQQDIWSGKPEHYSPSGQHFGCRLVFDAPIADGPHKGKRHLFFSIGDRGSNPRGGAKHPAQVLQMPTGKIHRVVDDGTIPTDNPFVNVENAYTSIWSMGHRNPQGLVFDLDGHLWNTEHSTRGGDELNLITKSSNYGWPIICHGVNYNGSPLVTPWPEFAGDAAKDKTLLQPVFAWFPSVGVCGLTVVQPAPKSAAGGNFDAWKGDLLAGGLSGQSVDRFRVKVGTDGTATVEEREEIIYNTGRVRDVAQGPDGMIYVVLNGPDRVIRLVPAR